MSLKKLNFLLLASLLAACNSEPSAAQDQVSYSSNATIAKLLHSTHSLEQKRLSDSQTAGAICPNSYLSDDPYFCLAYASESLKIKYPHIIQALNNNQQLKIYLYDGSIKYYQPSSQLDKEIQDYISFHVIAEYPQLDSLLILHSLYEGHEYILLNLNTGGETILSGMPIFSPDFHYMLSTNSDIEAGFTYNELKIYQLKSNETTLVFDAVAQIPAFHEKKNVGFGAAKWLGPTRFVVESHFFDLYSHDEKQQHFLVELHQTEWKFNAIDFSQYQDLKHRN